jgi:uncharacterized membrane protein YfcA
MAWIGALIVGLSLGLLGSGGSILTTPILKYLLGHEHKPALAESIIIVGVIALSGLIPAAIARRVDWRSVALFGLPAMGGMYLGVMIAALLQGPVLFILFAFVMLLAAGLMIRGKRPGESAGAAEPSASALARIRHAVRPHEDGRPKWFVITVEGLAVGTLTGVVGVGGGFMIVPALVLLGGLPMHVAVGTSLAIIALKAIPGTLKYLDVLSAADQSINWNTVAIFCVIGVVGTQIGMRVGGMLDQRVLKRIFAVLLVAMAGYIFYREASALLGAAGEGASEAAVGTTQPAPPEEK